MSLLPLLHRALAVCGTAVLTLTLACKVETVPSEIEPPPRPKRVPADAVWAGGLDGGFFIQLSKAATGKAYRARIYDDQVGGVEFRGLLFLERGADGPIDASDPKTFDSWDGNTLHLRDGRVLTTRR